ncbi:MAG: sulfotransferase domain-containing protein, partial [Thermoguttaceae bacterium]
MVCRLLYELPSEYHCQFVFLQRRREEVLASQKVMLRRHGKETGTDDEAMLRIFRKELAKVQEWLRAQPNFSVVNVDYNQLVVEPRTNAAEINEFLGGGLNLEAMSAAVDPTQYRNRR